MQAHGSGRNGTPAAGLPTPPGLLRPSTRLKDALSGAEGATCQSARSRLAYNGAARRPALKPCLRQGRRRPTCLAVAPCAKADAVSAGSTPRRRRAMIRSGLFIAACAALAAPAFAHHGPGTFELNKTVT